MEDVGQVIEFVKWAVDLTEREAASRSRADGLASRNMALTKLGDEALGNHGDALREKRQKEYGAGVEGVVKALCEQVKSRQRVFDDLEGQREALRCWGQERSKEAAHLKKRLADNMKRNRKRLTVEKSEEVYAENRALRKTVAALENDLKKATGRRKR